jgi:phage FluMu gp28-like protein
MDQPLIRFHPYQQRWLDDGSRFKIGMFARQTGKTFTTCAEIVKSCVDAMLAGKRTRWVILSRGERQAKEAVDETIKPLTRTFFLIYRALLKTKQDVQFSEGVFRAAEADATYKTFEVTFPDGSRITALPANPDTARGFSANAFLDEFAFHRDSRAIWAALFPVVSKAGLKLRVTSTPNGKSNKFYELMTAGDTVWSRHRVTIHQAVAEGLERDIAELRGGLGDDELWQQEYELEWRDDASAWLPFELIFACEDADAGRPERYQGGPVYIGNDIAAGGGDLWVAWVWEQVGDVLWCRELVERRQISFAEQDAIMDDLVARYRVIRLAMDQTGMGEKPVEDARRRYGGVVEGVHFTAPAKLSIASLGKQRFEDRKVRIPAGNIALRADLHSLVKLVGPTGMVRFVAPREGGSHADRTWAAFLGLAAADLGHREYAYEPASPRRPDEDFDDEGDGGGWFDHAGTF